MRSALVAGHICLDMTPIFSQGAKEKGLLDPGKLFVVGPADIHSGGVVSNTGLAMQFYGADVELLAKVGDDSFGKIISSILASHRAKARIKVDKTGTTSYSIVLARPGVDRTFLHCPGCNDTFTSADVTDEDLKGKSLFHFGYPTLMKKMYENEGEELLKLLKHVKGQGVVTSLDLSSVDPSSPAGKQNWDTILKKCLPYVDFFVPSFEELCFMLERQRYEELEALKGDMCLNLTLKDLEDLAEKCLTYGAGFVLLKAGAAGMYYACSPKEQFSSALGLKKEEWDGIAGFEKSFVPDCICSGTGAGDTAIAAFLTSALNGESLKHSVQLAAASGACCLTSYDALSGLKPFKDMEAKIKSGWSKQDILK